MTIEKLEATTADLTRQNIARLAELFPECVTEGPTGSASDRGEPVIDFDLLRQAVADHLVEGPQERYRLEWPGKRQALLTANAPIDKTLRPMREDSVDFDTTRNLFIEGDNLDALKLLQETYLGKVKMIYIDPPYNTGKDFIYKDNFAQSRESYEAGSGQRDEEGGRLVANPETNGRFHSDWLSMMYSRLKLARNLLEEGGSIFISIDDNELHNLTQVLNEIFGSSNFVATLVWEKTRKNDAKLFSRGHDYILVYAKSKEYLKLKGIRWREAKPGAEEIQKEYQRLRSIHGPDDAKVEAGLVTFYGGLPRQHPSKRLSRYRRVDAKGVWRDDNMSWPGGDGPRYELIHPVTGLPCAVPEGGWRYATHAKMLEMIRVGKVEFRPDHTEPPMRKTYLIAEAGPEGDDELDGEEGSAIQVAGTYFYRSALQATSMLENLFGEKNVFDSPKDHEILARLVRYVTAKDKDAVIVDFFSGSGTTAHAVMDANANDSGRRKYIAVQLPEELAEKDDAAAWKICIDQGRKANIASISRERIRLAGIKLLADSPHLEGKLDVGFRAFRIDSGNFQDTRVAPDQATQATLDGLISHIKDDRTDEDLLFGALLRWGVDVTLPVRRDELFGRAVWIVDPPSGDDKGAALIACFVRPENGQGGIDTELADAMAAMRPLRVLFRDDGFTSDAVKENVASRFKQRAPDTVVKVL